jgi:hypothetical protein
MNRRFFGCQRSLPCHRFHRLSHIHLFRKSAILPLSSCLPSFGTLKAKVGRLTACCDQKAQFFRQNLLHAKCMPWSIFDFGARWAVHLPRSSFAGRVITCPVLCRLSTSCGSENCQYLFRDNSLALRNGRMSKKQIHWREIRCECQSQHLYVTLPSGRWPTIIPRRLLSDVEPEYHIPATSHKHKMTIDSGDYAKVWICGKTGHNSPFSSWDGAVMLHEIRRWTMAFYITWQWSQGIDSVQRSFRCQGTAVIPS